MSDYKTGQIRNTTSQATIPKTTRSMLGVKANGLLLRGCIVQTYVCDDPVRSDNPAMFGTEPGVAVYCDVLVYSSIEGQRWQLYRKVLVAQDRGGLHNGRVWKPKAATFDITGASEFCVDGGSNPMNWDGDHVLVGFLDNSLSLPVILAGIPHPSQDVGGVDKEVGHRLRVKVADGDPDFHKHYGSFFGLDDKGQFIVDTTQAYAAGLEATGNEPAPPGDGAVGNHKIRLQPGSKLTIEIAGGPTLEVALSAADATLKLGDGMVHATIYEKLEAWWNTVKAKLDAFDAHVHPTGVGPSGAPAPLIGAPAMNVNVKSTKVSFPDA